MTKKQKLAPNAPPEQIGVVLEYQNLDDLTKIRKQWVKLSGLHYREEWSAAVVRAATAAELAASFAIRKEFEAQGNLTKNFIDELLFWANGIQGKFDRLLKHLVDHQPEKKKSIRLLTDKVKPLNGMRNKIAHGGHFCNEKEAQELIEVCKEIVLGLVHLYEPRFALKERKLPKK